MMDGLGLAETTPGPLILVTEFVGYIAGYRAGGVGMGIAAAVGHALGHVRALFPVDIRRRALYRATPVPALG